MDKNLRDWIHDDKNIKDFFDVFDSMSEAQRQYDCFVSCVESGHIKVEQFEEYGFNVFNKEQLNDNP